MAIDEQAIEAFNPAYRSGVAARLAGIPVETLRVWERRYQVAGPRLSPRGHRLYSAEDVSRLALIKHLVDLGSPIGSIAGLPLAALRTMRSAAAAASRGASGEAEGSMRPVRVALVGKGLTALAGDAALRSTLEIVRTRAATIGAAEALQGALADVLAIELPSLQAEAVATIDQLVHAAGARHAIVVYRFSPAVVVRALRDRGHAVMRAPLDVDELERLCCDAIALDTIHASSGSSPVVLETLPNPRFDEQALNRLAGALTTLYCECPHHLVEILLNLGTFERYSAECASRGPDDAVLHRYLQRVAGSARMLFEDALVRVARAEGLALTVDIGKTAPNA